MTMTTTPAKPRTRPAAKARPAAKPQTAAARPDVAAADEDTAAASAAAAALEADAAALEADATARRDEADRAGESARAARAEADGHAHRKAMEAIAARMAARDPGPGQRAYQQLVDAHVAVLRAEVEREAEIRSIAEDMRAAGVAASTGFQATIGAGDLGMGVGRRGEDIRLLREGRTSLGPIPLLAMMEAAREEAVKVTGINRRFLQAGLRVPRTFSADRDGWFRENW